jgi:cytoskeletal protein CcmA (bactofilin family)
MFRRNNPVSGLQSAENNAPSMNELPLRPATASAPAAQATATPAQAANVQPMAPRPAPGVMPSQVAASAPKQELPVSRFGGIPGVLPRRVGLANETTSATGDTQGLRKLIVGREISLSGDITACDILVVEGNIEATLRDGRHLEITEAGHFKGSVEIDEADIAGKFEGSLTVRGRLKLRSTGQIEGTLSYGEIEVEAGGRLIGELKVLPASAQKLNKESAADNTATRTAAGVTG